MTKSEIRKSHLKLRKDLSRDEVNNRSRRYSTQHYLKKVEKGKSRSDRRQSAPHSQFIVIDVAAFLIIHPGSCSLDFDKHTTWIRVDTK